MTAEHRHAPLDVVELLTESGRRPARTLATVVEADDERVLVEIAGERGHALDFVSLPHVALAPSLAHSSRVAS